MKIIINGRIITENNILKNKALIFDEKILQIVDQSDCQVNDYQEIIDANGYFVAPGLIDIHIHGAGGRDTMDGCVNAIETISHTICEYGVTSFLSTTMTMSEQNIYASLDSIREAMTIDVKGARVLGAHLEGPFINAKYKGAQNKKFITKPDYSLVNNYLDIVKIITLAPEEDYNYKFIKEVRENSSIILSIGHSNSTYEEALEGIESGITHATHIFNAMSPLHHRNPGVVGAILEKKVPCELIADNIHVHPSLYKLLLKVIGKESIILISDSMKATGLKEGIYDLGGQRIYVKKGAAKLHNGTLAGSVLSLNMAVKNMFENCSLSLNEAINLASLNPAKALSINNNKGSISVDKDADLILLDENFRVHMTIVEGKTVFSNN